MTCPQVILASEAFREEAINHATGEAEAILRTAEAKARGIEMVARSLQGANGGDAASLRIAEKYIEVRRACMRDWCIQRVREYRC